MVNTRLATRLSVTLTIAFSLIGLAGCTTNAVTGKSQFTMPISQQVQTGKDAYGPSQQQQGGRYVVDPELGVYVNSVGQRVAAHADLQLPYEFVVLNNDVPNAWALPGGKIAVNRGLLTLLDDEAQLAAVLGHEVVHAAAEHSANQMMKAKILNTGVVIAGVAASKSDNAMLIGAGAALGAKAYQAHYGRSQELEADFYGIDYMLKAGYEPRASVEIQQKFVELSKGQDNSFFSKLFASHPPSQERVDKNREKTSSMPNGERNRTAFQRAIAQIKKDQPAYETHSKALAAAAEGNIDNALALTQKAINLQPNESLFYITQGQIYMQQKNTAAARKAFTTATNKNPEYFMGHLGKGMADLKANQKAAAKASLNQSMDLLKTHIGAYYLGEIYLGEGNKEQAVQYYQYAAQSGDEIGKAAQAQLSKLQPQS